MEALRVGNDEPQVAAYKLIDGLAPHILRRFRTLDDPPELPLPLRREDRVPCDVVEVLPQDLGIILGAQALAHWARLCPLALRLGNPSARSENDRAPGPDRERSGRVPARRVFGRDGADGLHEAAHLALHAREPRLQLENHLHAGQVYAQLARQREDDLESFDRLEIVKARVAGRARGADEALALVEAERLRMNPEPPGDHADENVGLPRSRGRFGGLVVRPGPLATSIHVATLL